MRHTHTHPDIRLPNGPSRELVGPKKVQSAVRLDATGWYIKKYAKNTIILFNIHPKIPQILNA
jgi:hypothetical protein